MNQLEHTIILEEEPKRHSFTNQIMEAQLPLIGKVWTLTDIISIGYKPDVR